MSKKYDVQKLSTGTELLKLLRQPKNLLKDVQELVSMIQRFEIMYGIVLKITYEK